MPNWCLNKITISHEDRHYMERVKKGLEERTFLESFIPVPKDADWFSFCVNEWGTKWDVEADELEVLDDGHKIVAEFQSAWGPPTGAYEKLKHMGFLIHASYYESGVGFTGEWIDGINSIYYIPDTVEKVKEEIPVHLDEYWGISLDMECCQTDEDENPFEKQEEKESK